MSSLQEAIIQKIVEYFRSCCKPIEQRQVGAELEKIAFDFTSDSRISFSGARGIENFLQAFHQQGNEIVETQNGRVLAVETPEGTITLEPGAQLEIGTHAWPDIHATYHEWLSHMRKAITIGKQFNYRWLAIGIDPKSKAEEVELLPKKRYDIMAGYLPGKGHLAASMMRLTAAVQVNLDYTSEEDAISMLRTGLAITPLVTAMFANSPFVEQRDSGYLSYRTYVWSNTDPDRCGLFTPIVDQDDFCFADYAKLLLQLPLMFRYDDNHQIIAADGQNLLQWMEACKREPTTEEITTAIQQYFTEVRLKAFVEFRGIDCPPPELTMAVPALWAGLIYDRTIREQAWQIGKSIDSQQRQQLWIDVARKGIAAETGGRPILPLLIELLELAEQGLKLRNYKNQQGQDETVYLQPLKELIAQNKTPADILLAKWQNQWQNPLADLLKAVSYEPSFFSL